MNLTYRLPLLAVRDIEVSKRFYCDIFHQYVVLDLGKNVTFSGGFSVQEDFARLVEVPVDSVLRKSHNMELYFEVDDFDAFAARLAMCPEISYVHRAKRHDWNQRVIRIYDPDFHIIEIGESMSVIARRYLSAGYSVPETATLIQHPIEFVTSCME